MLKGSYKLLGLPPNTRLTVSGPEEACSAKNLSRLVAEKK